MATSGTGAIATFGDMAKITNVVIDGTYNANQCIKYSDIWSTEFISFSITSMWSSGWINVKVNYASNINLPEALTIGYNYTTTSTISGTYELTTAISTNTWIEIKRTSASEPSAWVISSAIWSSTGSRTLIIDNESTRIRTKYTVSIIEN